jgi:hypothetical protein
VSEGVKVVSVSVSVSVSVRRKVSARECENGKKSE